MASTDAKPVPQKGVAYRVTFPILDADGDLVTGAASLDSEVSKDGAAFADCTNEATEIATNSGVYFLDITSTEMSADTVAIIVKTSTVGAKTTTIVLYPEEVGDIRVNVTAYGGTAGTFSSGRPEVNTTHVGGTSQTAGDIIGDTNDIQTRLPAALVGGRIDASVGAMAANTMTAAAAAADLTTELQTGLALAADLAVIDDFLDTEIAAIKAKTDQLAFTTANRVDSQVFGMQTDTITSGALAASALAEINAEVVDCLNVDTYAEPGQGAPAATASLVAKLGYLYKGWRNKITQTNSQYSLYADDAATVDQKATVADDGNTFTRGEVASGP